MNTQEINFIKGLTEQDAIYAIRNARDEGRHSAKDTDTFKAYMQILHMIREYIRDGGKVGLDVLKFYFYLNKYNEQTRHPIIPSNMAWD